MSALAQAMARTTRPRLALALYGLAVAAIGTTLWVLAFPNRDVTLESSRQAGIAGSVAVLDHGGPPLVVRRGGTYYPANEGDDEGIYLALGELGHWTGAHDPIELFKAFSGAAMGVVVALAAPVTFLLLDSLALALLAPLGVLASFPFLANRDVYFTNAWIVLVGLPLAWLALERPWRWRYVALALGAGALAASCCNAIRSHSATGVALALAAVALLRSGPWRARLGTLVVVALCYAAVNPVALSIIRSHAYSEAHVSATDRPAAHSLWHPTYLGLGYLPNGWGIRWSDRVGEETVHRIDPNAAYLSPRYEQILRRQYFSIVRHHPFWVARLYAVKLGALVWDAVKHGGALVLLLPAALAAARDRRRLGIRLLLLVPALVLAAIPPLLTLPTTYDSGVIACLDLVGALALGTLVRRRWNGIGRRAALASGLLLAAVAACAITTHDFAQAVARQIGG
jgi:hypothetical protein